MTTVLLLLLLAGLLGVAWFLWPSISAEREQERRLQQIDQIRRRALIDMEYVAERARRERLQQSCQRLDQVIDEHGL